MWPHKIRQIIKTIKNELKHLVQMTIDDFNNLNNSPGVLMIGPT